MKFINIISLVISASSTVMSIEKILSNLQAIVGIVITLGVGITAIYLNIKRAKNLPKNKK